MPAPTCNRCGTPGLEWAQSQRTGRYYLVLPGQRIPHPCVEELAEMAKRAPSAPAPSPAKTVPCRCCQGTGRVSA